MREREKGCKTNVVAFEKKRRRKEEGARAIKGGRKKKKLLRFFLNLQPRKCFVRIS